MSEAKGANGLASDDAGEAARPIIHRSARLRKFLRRVSGLAFTE
jgi:hypothetical protein